MWIHYLNKINLVIMKNKNNKLFLVCMIVFAFTSSYVLGTQNSSTEKPNIIFLFADDLGLGNLSCNGSSNVKTPSLDKLAIEGTLFTQFYVAGSVCSPSHAGIMSGHFQVYGHAVNRPPMIAVREGDYKLLINPDDSRVELYNIITDPSELNNFVSQKPKLVKKLSEKANTWLNELPESPWDEIAGQNAWNWPKQKE